MLDITYSTYLANGKEQQRESQAKGQEEGNDDDDGYRLFDVFGWASAFDDSQ